MAKRKAEEQEAAKANRAAKKLRLEMRRRGHVKVPKKGQEPAADQREKQLTSLATRGVVLLFNAVAKAQKQQQDAGATTGAKPVKLNKASFLAQLKGAAAAADAGAGAGGAAGGGSVLGLGGAKAVGDAPNWRVLQQDFTGLPCESAAGAVLGDVTLDSPSAGVSSAAVGDSACMALCLVPYRRQSADARQYCWQAVCRAHGECILLLCLIAAHRLMLTLCDRLPHAQLPARPRTGTGSKTTATAAHPRRLMLTVRMMMTTAGERFLTFLI